MGLCLCMLGCLKTRIGNCVFNFPKGIYNYLIVTPPSPSLPLQTVSAAGEQSQDARMCHVPAALRSHRANFLAWFDHSPSDLHRLFYFLVLGCTLWTSDPGKTMWLQMHQGVRSIKISSGPTLTSHVWFSLQGIS